MGLFDRLSLVVRANLNDIVSQSANPEAALEQLIIDLQENLVQLRQAVARAIAEQKRTEQKYQQDTGEASKWEQRAKLALSKGDENLAREALTRKKSYTDTAIVLKQQLDQQTEQVDNLRRNLVALENKISEAKTKKNMLQARLKASKANEELQKTLGNIDINITKCPFERMEAKVLEMEARSQAIDELDDYGIDWSKLPLNNFKSQNPPSLEKAIQDTRNSITQAKQYRSEIQKQSLQAQTDIKTFHEQALAAFNQGDFTTAVHSFHKEAIQKVLADIFKTQLEKQKEVVYLLERNLAVLKEVKAIVEKPPELAQGEEDDNLNLVDAELEELRSKLKDL